MPVRVGTSGWHYADWRHRFFHGVPQRRWFEHTLAHFRAVELNVSFYRLPRREVFTGWRDRSPDDAIITVKASRYITHVKRLRDAGRSVALLMDRAGALEARLGPILIRLPPDLTVDVAGLAATLDTFPPAIRLAVEPRTRRGGPRRYAGCWSPAGRRRSGRMWASNR